MPSDLERDLRQRCPAVRFLSERRLRKLLQSLKDAGERVTLNPDPPLWIDKSKLIERDVLAMEADAPERILLMTPPEDRSLFRICDDKVRNVYSRLLFRAELMVGVRGNGSQEAHSFWTSLSDAQRREIEFVLHAEHLIPDSPTDEELLAAFWPYYCELREFQSEALPFIFPLLDSCRSGRRLERSDSFPAPTPSGLEDSTRPTREDADCARGNFVRAAVTGSPTALAMLCERLGAILEWDDVQIRDWRAALQPLVMAAARSHWPREKRALYDLQRIVADFSGSLDAVAPVEWLLSLGRKPLRRSLEPVRDVIVLRRLHSAAKQIERSTLSAHDRERVESLLDAEIHSADHRIRERLGPVIHRDFDGVGFVPKNLPERIGREKLVAELLDRLSENGFLRMADLRDAIARNQLKMPDATFASFLHGDFLLQIDRRLADDLHGVYHRGELYLRTIQRASGLAFGTPWGRWLTLFVALPFGGAFLAVEAAKHIGHAATKLSHAIRGLVEHSALPEAPKGHHTEVFTSESLAAIGILGVIFLALLHIPAARQIALLTLAGVGRTLSAFFAGLAPPVRLMLDNQVTRFISRFVLWPTFFALLFALGCEILYPDLRLALLVAAGAFVAAAILNLTPRGIRLREDVADYCHDTGRRFFSDILPGIASALLWFFRELLGFVERGLYSIDEWFRYREGQSKPSLALKATLAFVWFPIAYVVRFAFYLLLEPQVNPIKHFPVVTVSHKVLFSLLGTVKDALGVSIETATAIITMIPGIFGFLAWECRENWRLFAANRPATLPPTPLGHHGETVRGLLRPGFHSGTIPKLFRRFRAFFASPVQQARQLDHLNHELHHLRASIERLIERELLAYWQTVPTLAAASLESVAIGVQRIEVTIALKDTPMRFSFEHIGGAIIGTIDDIGWASALAADSRAKVDSALKGLFASAAVRDASVAWTDWLTCWSE